MANPNEIAVLKAVLTQAQKVIEFDRFYAALYDRVAVQLEFPVMAQRCNGKMEVLTGDAVPWQPRPYDPEAHFPDALFPAGQPIFIERNLQTWLEEREGTDLVCVPEPDPWPVAWLGAPLKARGRTIGFVVIEHHSRERAYNDGLQRLFQAMVNRAGGTLATARLVESLRLVNRVGQTLTAGAHLTIAEILVLIYEEIGRLMDNRDMYVALFDRGTQTLSFPLAFEDGKQVAYPSRKAELVDQTRGGLTEMVLRERQPFCPPDVAKWYAERGGPPVTAPIPKSWMGVPLLRGEQVLGVIALQNDEVEELYGSDDIEVLQAMSGAAAVALANTRLFEQLSVVNDAGQKLAAGIQLNQEQILDAIYEQASRLMDTRDMYIALYDAETQELSFPLAMFDGEPQDDWPSRKIDLTGKMQGLTEVVLQTRESLCPADVEDWYKKQNIEPKVKPVPKSWVGVPLVRGDQVLGIISLQNDEVANLYGVDEIAVLQTLAGQAAVALENAVIYSNAEELVKRRTQELESLQKIGMELTSELNLEEVLGAIAENANTVVAAEFSTIFSYDVDHDIFEKGIRKGTIEDIPSIPSSKGFAAQIAHSQNPEFVEDVTTQTNIEPAFLESKGVKSFAGMPLVFRGKTVGVLFVNFCKVHKFPKEERNILITLANYAAIGVGNAREVQKRVEAEQWAHLGRIAGSLAHRIGNKGGIIRLCLMDISEYLEQQNIGTEWLEQQLVTIARNNQYLLSLSDYLFKPREAVSKGLEKSSVVYYIQDALKYADVPQDTSVDLSIADALPFISGNKYLVDVFLELIENAMDAMKTSPRKMLTIRAEQKDEYVEVRIIDTGPGIAVDDRGLVFELFSRVSDRKLSSSEDKDKHRGFGLWWAKTFLNEIGGDIVYESTEEGGAIFAVKLAIAS